MRSTRRKLLVVSAGLGLSGGGTAVVGRLTVGAAADWTAESGWDLEVLDFGPDEPTSVAVPVRRLPGRRVRLAAALLVEQRAGRAAAIVFDHLGPARLQAWMPRSLRAPYLVWLYGIEAWRPLSGDRARALAGAAERLAISEHTARLVKEKNPWLDGVRVVPLALEERGPDGRVDEALLGRCGDGYFLIVGRMAASERYKGHDALLRAFRDVQKAAPAARLVVVGGGDDRPRLERLAAELGLCAAVLFTGFVSEATLRELYRRSLALVMPSRGEGFGLVYLEAMRAGKPCVAARGGAPEEIVEEGRTGFLVGYDDVGALRAALAALLSDRARAAAMGEAGRLRWETEFSLAGFRSRLHERLDALAAARAS